MVELEGRLEDCRAKLDRIVQVSLLAAVFLAVLSRFLSDLTHITLEERIPNRPSS